MLFELKNATIKEVLDVVSGTSRSGSDWTKATVIVEHGDGQYTDTYPLQAFGEERIRQAREAAGGRADVKFSVQGREYKGRWYADLRLQYLSASRQEQAPAEAPAQEWNNATAGDGDGDLPF